MSVSIGLAATAILCYGVVHHLRRACRRPVVLVVAATPEARLTALVAARLLWLRGHRVALDASAAGPADDADPPVLLDRRAEAALRLRLPLTLCTGQTYATAVSGGRAFSFRHGRRMLAGDMLAACETEEQRRATRGLVRDLRDAEDGEAWADVLGRHPAVPGRVLDALRAVGSDPDVSAGGRARCLRYYERTRWRIDPAHFAHAVRHQTPGLGDVGAPVGTVVVATGPGELRCPGKARPAPAASGAFGFYAALEGASRFFI